MSTITIAGRKIGPGNPVWIVAELSGNHNRSYLHAVQLIKAAHAAGAEAIKTQCFTPESLTIKSDRPEFRITWRAQETTLYDLYSETAMPMDWHPKLKALAESLGMAYFASAFDAAGVDFLEGLGVSCHKIASFEVTDWPLLRRVSECQKPVILSTGMASLSDIQAAIGQIHWYVHTNSTIKDIERMRRTPVILLKCTSAYPASIQDANLLTMKALQNVSQAYGLSDHTLGIAVPVAAVAMGASIIEKHLCLDRSAGGPDSGFSLEPAEFKAMVDVVRMAEAAMGSVSYGPTESEKGMLKYRRSLFVVQDVAAGEVFTPENVRSIRPAAGMHPRHYDEVLGRRAKVDVERGEPLAWNLID